VFVKQKNKKSQATLGTTACILYILKMLTYIVVASKLFALVKSVKHQNSKLLGKSCDV